MAPEDSTEVVLVRMDGRLSVVEGALRELRQDVRGGFAALQFVRLDVYESEKRTAEDFAKETRRIAEGARTVAESARTISWSTAGFVLTALGLVLALIKAVAG